jgi:hypothetical protein
MKALFSGIKSLGNEACHLRLPSAEIENEWSCVLCSSYSSWCSQGQIYLSVTNFINKKAHIYFYLAHSFKKMLKPP